LPNYNPDNHDDLDDYWASSASYHQAKKEREAASDARMGTVTTKDEWLTALSKALSDDDTYVFTRLREIAKDWSHDENARSYMLTILDNILDLQMH
jgi:hypothetical protein